MEGIFKAIETGNSWLNGIVWGIPALVLLMGAGAAFNYCQFTSIKKSQNFFQMRFIENLSFALKNGFKKSK